MENILEKIHKSTLKFLVPLEPGETYATIVDEAMKLVGAEYGTILLMQKDELRRAYSSDLEFFKLKPRKTGFTYTVFKTRQPLILTPEQVEEVHPEAQNLPFRSDILIPLSYKNSSIGVLSIVSLKDHHFSEKELGILKIFGSLATLAIKKAQLYAEAKEALEMRDIFMSMAAHELRTPLTTICGYIQLLNAKYGKTDTNEARWVRELYNESNRLKTIINEFLEVNRIKAGKLHFELEECSLCSIAEQVISNFKLTNPQRNIKLQDQVNGSPDKVIGDKDKLYQVLVNLVENGLKYSPPDSEIIISLSFKSPCFILKVKDRGTGIASKDLNRIFEGFYRGENSQQEGMGLGLFLAKNIIERHRGDIKIHSKLNKGTTVEVRLPKASSYGNFKS